MWGKRKRGCGRLPRQLALGLLEDAMGRVQQQESEEGEPAVPHYPGTVPPPEPPGLRAADVPVDNSAGPEPADPETPLLRDLPGSRTRERSHHGTFG